MNKREVWMFTDPKKTKPKFTDIEKNEISAKCQPLVESFKKQFINKNPDKRFNYCTDIYTGWYRNYLYFIEKYKSEGPYSIADSFEVKFVRLEYTGKDKFNFSYMRHTEQWFLVMTDMSLKDCLEMMKENPSFQPIG